MAAVVAAAALIVVVLVTLRGYDPGDASGATRMESTRQTGLISLALGLGALLPVHRVRWVLLAGAMIFLLLSLLFSFGVVGGR